MQRSFSPCTAESPSVSALKAGDEHAFRCLVEQERERLRRFVLKIVGDRDEAENIVQETFAEAVRQIDRFRGEAKVSTWLFSIARHQAYGFLRKRRRQPLMEEQTLEFLGSDGTARENDTQDAVESDERRRIVHEALDELPDHYRRVVELRDLKEQSTAETADELGLTEVNVRVRLHRARKALKTHLCDRGLC